MKLPPKTLHHPRHPTTHDDMSELTMRDYYPDTSSDVSSTNSATFGGTNHHRKSSKNRLTKYLLKKGNNAIKSVKTGNSSVGDKSDHHPPTTTLPHQQRLKSTVADQMVATMFQNSKSRPSYSDNPGVERAMSWKNEVNNSLNNGNNNGNGTTSNGSKKEPSSIETSSIHSMEYSSMNVTTSGALGYRSEAVGAAAMAVEFGLSHNDREEEEEEGVQRQQHYSQHRGGVVQSSSSSSHHPQQQQQQGGNRGVVGNHRARSSSSDEPMAREGVAMERVWSHQNLPNHRRRTVASGERIPPSKSMNNLSDLELLGQTVQCVNAALQSSTKSNIMGATTTTSSTMDNQDDEQQQLLHDNNTNYHISSFKFNPRGCVWYAVLTIAKDDSTKNKLLLQVPIKVTCHANDKKKKSSSSSTTTTTTDGGVTSSSTNNIKTTYTVTISYYEPPTTTTTTNTTTNTNWTTTFHENFPTMMDDISNIHELTALWINSSVEVIEGMEWLRRKLRRWISKSMGRRMVVQLLPDVIVVLPEEKGGGLLGVGVGGGAGRSLNDVGRVHSSLMSKEEKLDHCQEGKTGGGGSGGGVDQSTSPMKKNVRSVMSVDPSTSKTATTCSLSSHYSSHHSPVEEESDHLEEEDTRLEEARAELLGKKKDSSSDGGNVRKTTTAAAAVVEQKRLAGQKTMRRLLSSDASFDDDESEEEEKEEIAMKETARTYRPTRAKGNKVANLVENEGEVRGEMSGEKKRRSLGSEGDLSAAGQQARGQFRQGLVSQMTMRRILQEEAEEDTAQVVKAMESEHRAKGEIRVAKAGLMSRNTILRMRGPSLLNEADVEGLDLSSSDRSGTGVAVENEARGETSGEKNVRSLKSESDMSAAGQQAIGRFREGLISQNTMKRILREEAEKETAQVVKAMESEHRAEGEIRVAKAGLMSRKTMLQLRNLNSEADTAEASSNGAAARPRRRISQIESDQQTLKSWEEDSHFQTENVDGLDAVQSKDFKQTRRLSPGEINMMQQGLVSQQTQRFLAEDLYDSEGSDDPDLVHERNDVQPNAAQEAKHEKQQRRLSAGEMNMMKQGLISQQTQRFLAEDLYDSEGSNDLVPARETEQEKRKRQLSEREMKMLRRGCASRRSLISADVGASRRSTVSVDSSLGGMKRVPSQIHVSFMDESNSDTEAEEPKTKQAAEVKKKTTKKVVVSEDDDDDENVDLLVFSKTPLERTQKLDILTEGQYFLGISMLVYMYSHLRETCRMGHTRCSMEDVDTHSVQSHYKGGRKTKYLKGTKTAGSIIRLVIDELDDAGDNDADHEIVGGESKEYERQQTAQFRKWIDDSRISQMDEETEKLLIEMKRKVARHRWKRAISAVRLSYRISGGKPPKWENPVVAPGCENCNRFVDMNEMMNETMRKQPKYFKDGSVMNNLIESGIEVVWFSDLSQNDVVYGICVNREERKIIIVFRGTVNAHNWSMNFKFDTNEYRNPIKVNYPGREDELSLHSGFALYLLRKRKDTGLSKMDEIFEKVEQVGKEVAPDGNYQLCITGHSLGGALATLCGFYCGAKPRFAHLSTIYIWTFAAPRVGTQAFIQAYQYLERAGRIKHARFSCTNDIVPLIPFCNFEYDDLQFYKHVGVRVQLHDTGRVGKWRLRNNLDVTYPLKHDWPSEIRRQLMNNIFANLNTPSGFKDVHGLTEHQRRLHFAMTYRKALGSSELNSDQRRKRIKTLDEYYLIRAHIATDGIADEIVDIQKVDKVKEKVSSSKWLVRFLALLLLFTWMLLILSITTDVPLDCVLVPFTMVLHGIEHLVHLPVTLPLAVYQSVMFRTQHMIHSMLVGTRHVGKSTFVARNAPPHIDVMRKLAAERVKHNVSRHAKEIIDAKSAFMQEDSSKFQVFERTSTRLYNLASIVDNLVSPQLTIVTPVEGATPYEVEGESSVKEASGDAEDSAAKLEALESRLNPIQEYATGVSFAPKLDNGLYLVGAGVRKKSVVKVYAVAMYSTPKVLANAASSTSLHDTARTLDSTSSLTSFVLEMVYSAGAEKIAGAIGESVKPRHGGDPSDIGKLESLIVEGVNAIGGQATKGTMFRFDCSDEGVSVSVNGVEQGVAEFKGLGSAFVDVFMDGNSVSPTLVESCVKTWSSSENMSIAASLVDLASVSFQGNSKEGTTQEKGDTAGMRKKLESQLKPIQEYATSVVFDPKLAEGLYLVGAGVRKKSVVKVYAVALYGSASVLNAASSPAALRTAARSFGQSSPSTSFVLEMTYSASAEKIGGAIADSVKPRYSGSASDISELESLIIEGVNNKGGQASKGTMFRFDCSEEGVTVSVDGSVQGVAKFAGMGAAFVDVFLDDDAVSPTLVSSCMDNWSNPQAKAIAASLLELGDSSDETSDKQDDEGPSSSLQNAVESNMKSIQEYATSVTFVPKLEDGLYLAGAGVRKKSIVKVYAVAMYSSPVVLQALSKGSKSAMHNAARSFSPDSPLTTFVLEMTYSAGAEKIAGAIAESVKPRYNGNPTDINELEALIVKGVNMKGGQASKGTIFRFDCSQDGVRVSVDGSDQGMAAFEGMGGAFVDVFLDDNAVSPSLIDSCVETWSKVSLH